MGESSSPGLARGLLAIGWWRLHPADAGSNGNSGSASHAGIPDPCPCRHGAAAPTARFTLTQREETDRNEPSGVSNHHRPPWPTPVRRVPVGVGEGMSASTDDQGTLSLATRLLHLGISVGVSLQLMLSTFMERPRPGAVRGAAEGLGFTLHEVVGGLLLPLLVGWFLWAACRGSEPGLAALFPWVRGEGRRALLGALCRALDEALRGRLAPEAEILPLVRTVHGLGALCALFMASSGALVWWGMAPSGALPPWAAIVLDLHQSVAILMWVYLAGHAGMALLHQWHGDGVLRRMFSLGQRRQAA